MQMSMSLGDYFNKRPRGLYDLLSHMLDKRIPVRYKLGSTKKSKVDTMLSKTENATNDSKLNLTT